MGYILPLEKKQKQNIVNKSRQSCSFGVYLLTKLYL